MFILCVYSRFRGFFGRPNNSSPCNYLARVLLNIRNPLTICIYIMHLLKGCHFSTWLKALETLALRTLSPQKIPKTSPFSINSYTLSNNSKVQIIQHSSTYWYNTITAVHEAKKSRDLFFNHYNN